MTENKKRNTQKVSEELELLGIELQGIALFDSGVRTKKVELALHNIAARLFRLSKRLKQLTQ